IARLRGDLAEAERIHRASLVGAASDRRPGILLNLAWVLALRNDRTASEMVKEARQEFERREATLEIAECRFVQAHKLLNQKNPKQALVHLKAALKLYAQSGARRLQSETHRKYDKWRREVVEPA